MSTVASLTTLLLSVVNRQMSVDSRRDPALVIAGEQKQVLDQYTNDILDPFLAEYNAVRDLELEVQIYYLDQIQSLKQRATLVALLNELIAEMASISDVTTADVISTLFPAGSTSHQYSDVASRLDTMLADAAPPPTVEVADVIRDKLGAIYSLVLPPLGSVIEWSDMLKALYMASQDLTETSWVPTSVLEIPS